MWKRKVSVIIATHNRRKLLERALISILNQTFQDFEIIVSVDASTDDTLDYLQVVSDDDKRIRFIYSKKNLGPGTARNMAIDLAEGEYIAVMDDDDIAVPERLAKQVAILEARPDVGLVYSSVAHVDDDLRLLRVHPDFVAEGRAPIDPDEVFTKLYLTNCFINNTTWMIRENSLGDLRYPDKPWSGEDWLLVSKLAARGVRMVAIPEPLVLMRRTQGMESLTANQRAPEDYLRAVGLVKNLQSWLKAQGITRFRHLDKKALANKYFYGYKENTGKQKINLLRRTICLDPLNKKYWAEIKRIIQRKISSLRG